MQYICIYQLDNLHWNSTLNWYIYQCANTFQLFVTIKCMKHPLKQIKCLSSYKNIAFPYHKEDSINFMWCNESHRSQWNLSKKQTFDKISASGTPRDLTCNILMQIWKKGMLIPHPLTNTISEYALKLLCILRGYDYLNSLICWNILMALNAYCSSSIKI